MNLLDITIYAWASLFWLCLCVGFPPLALGYLALPAIHRKRMAARKARQHAAYLAAKEKWILKLR